MTKTDNNQPNMPTRPHTAAALLQRMLPNMDSAIGKMIESSLRYGAPMRQMVSVFHKVYGVPVRNQIQPCLSNVSSTEITLRIRLTTSEFIEWINAHGISCEVRLIGLEDVAIYRDELDAPTEIVRDIVVTNREHINVHEIADAAFDLQYVVEGANQTYGIDSTYTNFEGQSSNMTKLMPDGSVKKDSSGKILEGPDFMQPQWDKVIPYPKQTTGD